MQLEEIKEMFVNPSEEEKMLIAYVRTEKEKEGSIVLEFRGTIQKIEITEEEWSQFIVSTESFEKMKHKKFQHTPVIIKAEVVGFENGVVKIEVKKEESLILEFTVAEVQEAFEVENVSKEEIKEIFEMLKEIEIGFFKDSEYTSFKFLDLDEEKMTFKTIINGEEKDLNEEEFVGLINEWQEYGEEDGEEDLSEQTNIFDMNGNQQTKFDLALQRAKEDEQRKIQKYGFVIHNVFDEKNGKTDYHTHGIPNIFETLSKENPNKELELMDFQIVLPIEPRIAAQILHGIVENMVLKGIDVKKNKDKILMNYNVDFMEVESKGRKLLRILIPDENGKLPKDEECQLMYKKQMYWEEE